MSCEPGPRSNEILVYLQALPGAVFYRFATGIPPTDSLECALVGDPPCIYGIYTGLPIFHCASFFFTINRNAGRLV